MLEHDLLDLPRVVAVEKMAHHNDPPGLILRVGLQLLLQPGEVRVADGLGPVHACVGVGLGPRGVEGLRAELLVADPVLISQAAIIIVHLIEIQVHLVAPGIHALVVVLVRHNPTPSGVLLRVVNLDLPIGEAPSATIVMIAEDTEPRDPEPVAFAVAVVQVRAVERGVESVVQVDVRGHPVLHVQRRRDPTIVEIVAHIENCHRLSLFCRRRHCVRDVGLRVVVFLKQVSAAPIDPLAVRKHGKPAGVLPLLLALLIPAVRVRGGAPVSDGEQGECIRHAHGAQFRGKRHGASVVHAGVQVPEGCQARARHAPDHVLVDPRQVRLVSGGLLLVVVDQLLELVVTVRVVVLLRVQVKKADALIALVAVGEQLGAGVGCFWLRGLRLRGVPTAAVAGVAARDVDHRHNDSGNHNDGDHHKNAQLRQKPAAASGLRSIAEGLTAVDLHISRGSRAEARER
mmetsp:Transcript_40107/g.98741  ORF Transcript_40107/g.98741 Transcript_40107/m.98741 type:complete len:458 (-) Transcript_40107:7-1380(-)